MDQFVSSPIKLARAFLKSREAWKSRAQEQQRRAKALDGKVRDLGKSRDNWKAKAKEYQLQLQAILLQARTHKPAQDDAAIDADSDRQATTQTLTTSPQTASQELIVASGDCGPSSVANANQSAAAGELIVMPLF